MRCQWFGFGKKGLAYLRVSVLYYCLELAFFFGASFLRVYDIHFRVTSEFLSGAVSRKGVVLSNSGLIGTK